MRKTTLVVYHLPGDYCSLLYYGEHTFLALATESLMPLLVPS